MTEKMTEKKVSADITTLISKKIVFFGSQEAVMVNLYGDLKKYLDNYQP